jgi:tetratricopeptide (TPR) repeat protein
VGIRPEDSIQGKSLLPLINGDEKVERASYSESIYSEIHYGWSPLFGITKGDFKYIEAPKPELYDLKNDPGETQNLVAEKSSIAKVLKKDLQEMMGQYSRKDLKGPEKMDPDTEEKLRALGYIGTTVQSTPESKKIDPKDKIHLTKAIQLAYSAAMDKNYSQAVQYIASVLQEDPGMMDGQFIAGISYAGIGDYRRAVDHLMKTVSIMPDHSLALSNLGLAYEVMGDFKNAEFWYQKTLESDNKNTMAVSKLAGLYRAMNQPDKAMSYLQQAVRLYEEGLQKTASKEAQANIYADLGEVYFSAGAYDLAEKNIRSALSLNPQTPNLHYNLALVYEATGNRNQALIEYQKETQLYPNNYQAFNNLGLLFQEQNRFEEAAVCFQKVIQLDPKNPRGYSLLAQTYTALGRNDEAARILQQIKSRPQVLN